MTKSMTTNSTATYSTTVRPIGDRILVERDDPESKTPGGIVLPDAAKNKPQRGKVIAVDFHREHRPKKLET